MAPPGRLTFLFCRLRLWPHAPRGFPATELMRIVGCYPRRESPDRNTDSAESDFRPTLARLREARKTTLLGVPTRASSEVPYAVFLLIGRTRT